MKLNFVDTDLGSVLNYTVPEEERIAIVEGDRIGWFVAYVKLSNGRIFRNLLNVN
jgi:hypothetical protein